MPRSPLVRQGAGGKGEKVEDGPVEQPGGGDVSKAELRVGKSGFSDTD